MPPLLIAGIEPWQIARTPKEALLLGEHGFSNQNLNMHPIFLAKGPMFKTQPNTLVQPFNSVDIYPLMCHILGIHPSPNNGTLCDVGHLLKNLPQECSSESFL